MEYEDIFLHYCINCLVYFSNDKNPLYGQKYESFINKKRLKNFLMMRITKQICKQKTTVKLTVVRIFLSFSILHNRFSFSDVSVRSVKNNGLYFVKLRVKVIRTKGKFRIARNILKLLSSTDRFD